MDESSATEPAGLRRIQDFINTEDLDHRTDELSTPQQLASWLESRDLLESGAAADTHDLDLARGVRAALRELTFANNDGAPSEDAIGVLNRAADEAGIRMHFDLNGGHLTTEAVGIRSALGHLLIDVLSAMENGTWVRLKACRDDTCRWAYFDHSKNRSRAWCSMGVCGNRAKTRAYRRRSKASDGDSSTHAAGARSEA